jgi:hypothetical protein
VPRNTSGGRELEAAVKQTLKQFGVVFEQPKLKALWKLTGEARADFAVKINGKFFLVEVKHCAELNGSANEKWLMLPGHYQDLKDEGALENYAGCIIVIGGVGVKTPWFQRQWDYVQMRCLKHSTEDFTVKLVYADELAFEQF